MRHLMRIGVTALLVALSANSAYAWGAKGTVRCDANGNGIVDDGDLPLPGIAVTVVEGSVTIGTVMTEANGSFAIGLPDRPGSFSISIVPPTGASVVGSNPVAFATTGEIDGVFIYTFLVNSAACSTQACWLTGGGAKFSSLIGQMVAEKGPQHSFGGNVNPGCSPEAGEGGSWNHVAHNLKLHFHGQQIRVVRCGNVPGIEPGSESPVTPYNFIEFEGTGTMKGISGNKLESTPVTFFARAEDRNEPGSHGAKDGADIDRYFLHVWGPGGLRLLIDLDGNPNTVDPVTITGGNLQIHISSCGR